MKGFFRGCLVICLIVSCNASRGNWVIDAPVASYQFGENQLIQVQAHGNGPPNTTYDCRAFSDKDTGGLNEGTLESGSYTYSYPSTSVYEASNIDPGATGNSLHQ